MGQRPFQWFRLSRASRDSQKHDKTNKNHKQTPISTHVTPHAHLFTEQHSTQSPPLSPSHSTEHNYFQTLPQPFDPTIRESDISGYSSAHSSTIPYHSPSTQIISTLPQPPPFISNPIRSRRSRPSIDTPFAPNPRSLDDGPLSFELNHLHSPSFASEATVRSAQPSVVNSAADSVTGLLDNFVPHRPADRFGQPNIPRPHPIPDSTFTPTTTHLNSTDSPNSSPGPSTERRARYLQNSPDSHTTFNFRRRPHTQPPVEGSPQQPSQQDDYFGATQHDERGRSGEIRAGEEVLIKFLRNTLGPKAQNFAVRLMNKTPITSSPGFTYVIHQGTEESDIDIIRRDLTSGRLYSSGVRLLGGAWCNLLLGDRFSPGAAPRQRHELTYRRSSCSCTICRVRAMELTKMETDARSQSEYGSDVDSAGVSADVLSTMSTTSRTPIHSAMANFVVRYRLPEKHLLMGIGASSSSRELEIGSVVRLNYRTSAKLKFTEDVRELFGHYAYTGPISHEEVYRRVTTIGVHYYLYNKGKKERKVYIQGELIRLPINVGIIKLGTQPMYMPELGATFCLHRKQIMSIYVGEIVLEGNSIGSFINTGIQYYIGFGEERGVCPVYPNKTLGKARKLGINELLLHHHMVDDLEVKCL